jgi:SAM-dependent methyltransferase
LKAGKTVFAVDIGVSNYFKQGKWADHPNLKKLNCLFEDLASATFNPYGFWNNMDCLWASHVLEHQVNPNLFLKQCYAFLKPGGIFAVSVPPLKHQIVGGHVTLWNPGLLLYNLILAGFDCSKARLRAEGYNISVIVEKSPVAPEDLASLVYDWGDVQRLSKYFPVPFEDGYDGSLLTNIKWDLTASQDNGA